MRCPLLFGGGQGDILFVWRGDVRCLVCLKGKDGELSCLSGGGTVRYPVCLE